jgi:LysM repeat protein
MRLRTLFVAALSATMLVIAGSQSASAATQKSKVKTASKPQKVEVVVAEGDSLSKIATDKSTTYIRLFDANAQISDPDVIHPGDKVRIPTADEQLPDRPLPQKAAPAPVLAAPAVAPAAVSTAPAPVRTTAPVAVYAAGNSVWDSIAQCESGGNWATNTGNGFYGGLQFTLSSWAGVGGSGLPSAASREEQIMRAQILQSRQGWGAWPVCSAKLGL